MNIFLWLCVAFFILAVIFFGRKLLFLILKLFANGCVGMAVFFTANAIIPGMNVGINPFTLSVSSFLSFPGAVLICLLNRFI